MQHKNRNNTEFLKHNIVYRIQTKGKFGPALTTTRVQVTVINSLAASNNFYLKYSHINRAKNLYEFKTKICEMCNYFTPKMLGVVFMIHLEKYFHFLFKICLLINISWFEVRQKMYFKLTKTENKVPTYNSIH